MRPTQTFLIMVVCWSQPELVNTPRTYLSFYASDSDTATICLDRSADTTHLCRVLIREREFREDTRLYNVAPFQMS